MDCVAGDAVEGFNPAHDVCRLIVDGAVEILRRRTGREVRNYEFLLDGPPGADRPGSVVVRLDEAALERKLAAARDYPEMRAEVEAALGRYGRQAFAIECLRPAAPTSQTSRLEHELPDYERYGEMRVRRAAMPKSSATATTCARSPWRSRPRWMILRAERWLARRRSQSSRRELAVASGCTRGGERRDDDKSRFRTERRWEAIEPPHQLLDERHPQPIATRLVRRSNGHGV